MNQRRRALANPLFDVIAFGALFAAGFLLVHAWLDAGDASFSLDAFYRAWKDVHRQTPIFYVFAVFGFGALWFRPGTGDRRLG